MNGKKILLLTVGTLLAMGLGYALVGLKPPKTAASEPLAAQASSRVASEPLVIYLDPSQAGSGTTARGYEDDDDEYEEYEDHEDEDDEDEEHEDDDEYEEHEDDEDEDEDD